MDDLINRTDDLISRQDAIRIIDNINVLQSGWFDKAIKSIKDLPSAQHTAAWELDEQQEHVEKIWHCSNCGYRAWGSYEKTDFCGGCGADMRGETDERYCERDNKGRISHTQ